MSFDPRPIDNRPLFGALGADAHALASYTPPKVPDELNVPLTRRDALFVVQVVVEIQQANPLLAQSDLWPLVWERLTLAWRQPDVHQPSREEL